MRRLPVVLRRGRRVPRRGPNLGVAHELPIDGVLDLHTFRPADVKDLVPTYLAECRKRDILHVRIIHGKGTGALRETVHAILKRTAGVVSFGLAPPNAGGWGATVVELEGKPGGRSGAVQPTPQSR